MSKCAPFVKFLSEENSLSRPVLLPCRPHSLSLVQMSPTHSRMKKLYSWADTVIFGWLSLSPSIFLALIFFSVRLKDLMKWSTLKINWIVGCYRENLRNTGRKFLSFQEQSPWNYLGFIDENLWNQSLKLQLEQNASYGHINVLSIPAFQRHLGHFHCTLKWSLTCQSVPNSARDLGVTEIASHDGRAWKSQSLVWNWLKAPCGGRVRSNSLK